MRLPRHLTPLLLLAGLIATATTAATPDFPGLIRSIAEAEAGELARLEEAIAATTDTAAILSLQRCVTHVKLTSRLALLEAQLEAQLEPAADEPLHERISTLAADLRESLEHLERSLPPGYRFEPPTVSVQEVSSCDD